jgi:ferric-dicitrate binding protein FerR (iron transport regulator)
MKEGAITDRMMELAEKWLDGSITEQEKAEFSDWYNQFNDESATVPVNPAVLQREMLKAILARVHAAKQQQPPMVTRSKQWMRYAAVAAGLLLASATGYFLLHKKGTGPVTPLANKRHGVQDIPPGAKKAVLTLGDGSKVLLDSANNGLLAQQGSTNIMKTANGQIVYTKADEKSGNPLIPSERIIRAGIHHSPFTFNTLATPRGGQYELVLPDGSKVWLNAASSIRYPTTFTNDERKVEITGEAYFEIKRLPSKAGSHNVPFIVKISSPSGNGGEVEVLGTHFNINAYNDESAIRTTLLEGSVKVGNRQSAIGNIPQAVLTPGKQAAFTADSRFTIHDVDIEQVMAWKNGLFQFHNAGLPAVLRQIARWYDVDIRYEGDMPVREFEGKIQRNLTLLQVLKILEKNQVQLTLQGRTIIVKNSK